MWIAPDPVRWGFEGDVRCVLPLPLPTESVRAIVVQHVVADSVVEFFDECARVLMPGGCLYLFALNPLSPYRLRWLRQGPVAIGSSTGAHYFTMPVCIAGQFAIWGQLGGQVACDPMLIVLRGAQSVCLRLISVRLYLLV